jgi:hypothetical protein
VVSDDSDRNFDGNGPRTGVLVTSKVGVGCLELTFNSCGSFFERMVGGKLVDSEGILPQCRIKSDGRWWQGCFYLRRQGRSSAEGSQDLPEGHVLKCLKFAVEGRLTFPVDLATIVGNACDTDTLTLDVTKTPVLWPFPSKFRSESSETTSQTLYLRSWSSPGHGCGVQPC